MSINEIKKIAKLYGFKIRTSKSNKVIAGRKGEYVSVYKDYDELNLYLCDTNKLTYESIKNKIK